MQHKSNNSGGNPQAQPKREDFKNDDDYLSALIKWQLILSEQSLKLAKEHNELTRQFLLSVNIQAAQQEKEAKRFAKKLQLLAKKERIKAMQQASLKIYRDLKQINYTQVIKETNLEFG